MVSTFTPNIQLEEPARGDDVGTWDVPVNNNMTLLDKVTGAITTIGLNNSNVALSSPQFQSKQITFNSTLTGNVVITFPTSFTKSYEIQNLCSGTSAFIVVLETTAAGGQAIACPPGETIDVYNDGVNLKFKNLGRVGSYVDYAGTTVPIWVTGSTIQPYLNCDGTTFSSATFPQLTTILGGATLPDFRGRLSGYLNQGTGRITTASGGIDGNTNYAAGGAQSVTIGTSNLPAYTPSGTIVSTVAASPMDVTGSGNNGTKPQAGGNGTAVVYTGLIVNSVFTGAAQGGVSAPIASLPPMAIGGIRMIRTG
jgi:Phage Tail Collar Domain